MDNDERPLSSGITEVKDEDDNIRSNNIGDSDEENHESKHPQHLLDNRAETQLTMENAQIKKSGNSLSGANPEVESNDNSEDIKEAQYFMIVYRGIVPLMSSPDNISMKSGVYVSYGEIIKSSTTIQDTKRSDNLRPPTSSCKKETENGENSSNVTNFIQVDEILTGGYAFDDVFMTKSNTEKEKLTMTAEKYNVENTTNIHDETPKRSNFIMTTNQNNNNEKRIKKAYGFLYSVQDETPIAKKIDPPLLNESGSFTYQVCCKTPIQIYAGPYEDAPKTKHMVTPGSFLPISLKIKPSSSENNGPTFLRLSQSKGWLPDKEVIRLANGTKHITDILREISPQIGPSISNQSQENSYVSNNVRKRRPPRRVVLERIQQSSRRNHNSSFEHIPPKIDTISSISTSHLDSVSSPANKSIISDDSFISSVTKKHDLSISIAHSQSTSILDISTNTVTQRNPSFFLMRVHAPNGLKILDAPHFQVNKLIHGQTNQSYKNPSSPASSTISSSKPSLSSTTTSLFHNIASAYTNHNNHDSTSQKTSISSYEPTRTRTLSKGTIFEASKRMESAGVYTPGAALIKLSDNSGWAIVPHQEDLLQQFNKQHSAHINETILAVEEIGNSIPSNHSSGSTLWLRIFPRTGIYVTCPPPPPITNTHSREDSASSHSPVSSIVGSNTTDSHTSSHLSSRNTTHVDDGVSSIAGSAITTTTTSMFFRTPRKDHFIARPNNDHHAQKLPFRPQHMNKSPILACGMCVEVDPWEVTHVSEQNTNIRISQSFARLSGGQGWIPRQINGELFSFKIEPPIIRQGSFWFRVSTKKGIKVRQGPSRRASSIQSESGQSFRFECGEFLRASQTITIFGSPDTDTNAKTDRNNNNPFSECFAKLYRNSNNKSTHGNGVPTSSSSIVNRSLSELSVPGEFVQVHINQKYYLEECHDPPSIARHFDGWWYHALRDTYIRKGPSFALKDDLIRLKAGESVWVNERVKGSHEKVTWLRLKDGRGWVHDINPQQNELIMTSKQIGMSTRRIYGKRMTGNDTTDAVSTATSTTTYNSIMSRLFKSDHAVKGDRKHII